jgi:hypothetical protein
MEAIPSWPVVIMLPLKTVAPGSVDKPLSDNTPVPVSTPAGDLVNALAVESALSPSTGLLLAYEVSELRQNKLETASANTALMIAFESDFCMISPPRVPGPPVLEIPIFRPSPDYGKPYLKSILFTRELKLSMLSATSKPRDF